MNFLNPLALLGAAAAGLIVLMYLLKLRRQRHVISSTLLWVRTLEDLIANSPLQKLRQNLLMYLQILALLLVVAALARPTMWLERRSGVSRVVMIDNSASMRATDGGEGRTRLEEAQLLARRLLANQRRGDQAMLVTFGGPPRVVQPFTTERALLDRAVDRIDPTDAPAHAREALAMVRGVRKAVPDARLTIISDGTIGYLGNLVGTEEEIEFFQTGSEGENRGFTGFDVRRALERQDELEIFAEVENFGEAQAYVLVRCLIDGRVAAVRESMIAAGERQSFVFTPPAGTASASLVRLELGGTDLMPADDVVQGRLDLGDAAQVLLVGDENFFLERVLGLLPGMAVARVGPGGYEPTRDYALVVFDGATPAAIGPGRYLFINALPPIEGFAKGEQALEDQIAVDWNRLPPATRFVDFAALGIARTLALQGPEWMVPLVESESAPLIMAGEDAGRRVMVIGFDPYDSDWPLRISYPVFLANAVRWLLGAGEGSVDAVQHRTGDTVRFEGLALGEGGKVRITGPDDEAWAVEPNEDGSAYFNQTLRTGLYQVRIGEAAAQAFAVNLLSPEESAIKPAAALTAGERQIAAQPLERQNREVWPWLVLAGLAILTLEWHLYGRRSWL